MPLKLDHDIAINEKAREYIKSFKYTLCTVDQIKNLSYENKIISVGDVTTENLKNAGVNIELQVVDLVTKRDQKKFEHISGSVSVLNPPGTISMELIDKIRDFIASGVTGRIEVKGEEDLAVIPIIFYADKNTVIVYGIPDTGMAYIKINDEIKEKINNMIMEMYKNER
ncbi:DUF359 domain-containing protein [Ferroplasma sp.]|uniref:GTP-dependent dephospho-CoA kinase family protein n=1 Tax=Ferroplasma sp. TaxID=2591003 RepID=UPI00307D4C44